MLKIVKVGGLTLGPGVLLGLAVVGWLHFHGHNVPVTASNGGSVVLGTDTGPTPTPASGLQVDSPAKVAASGGAAQTLVGGSSATSNDAAGKSTADNSANKPLTPDQFHQFDQYASSANALYQDLVVGDGPAVASGTTAIVQYRGWLTDGRLFDDSYSRGKAFSFVEGGHTVIAGWEEGIFGMKVGGKRRLIVPAGQGYGSEAHSGIPANSLLIFDVELVAVQ